MYLQFKIHQEENTFLTSFPNTRDIRLIKKPGTL